MPATHGATAVGASPLGDAAACGPITPVLEPSNPGQPHRHPEGNVPHYIAGEPSSASGSGRAPESWSTTSPAGPRLADNAPRAGEAADLSSLMRPSAARMWASEILNRFGRGRGAVAPQRPGPRQPQRQPATLRGKHRQRRRGRSGPSGGRCARQRWRRTQSPGGLQKPMARWTSRARRGYTGGGEAGGEAERAGATSASAGDAPVMGTTLRPRTGPRAADAEAASSSTRKCAMRTPRCAAPRRRRPPRHTYFVPRLRRVLERHDSL